MPELTTRRLRLSPLVDADADELFALESDAATWTHFPMGRWTDPTRAQRFIDMSTGSHRRFGLGQWAVRLHDAPQMVGSVGVFVLAGPAPGDPMSVVSGEVERGEPVVPRGALLNIGWRMSPAVWRRGLATEAARAVRERAGECFPGLAMTAAVLSTNPASAAVCRHLDLSLVWTGVTGEVLLVRSHRPPVPGGAQCVRWFYSDRELPARVLRGRLLGL